METARNITAYLFISLIWMVSAGFAQPGVPPAGTDGQDDGSQTTGLAMSFRPSIAVTIVVLTTMFTLTFLLLLYAKHCKVSAARGGRRIGRGGIDGSPDGARPGLSAGNLLRKDSGIERSIIDALPVFKFASLQGIKEGLECAVCLSRFEGSEVLRLLPKCRHAFHVECVDTWLESHSTCPLCRYRVEAQDVFKCYRHEENVEEAKGLDDRTPQLLQVFVQRENVENPAVGESESSGFRVENSFRQPSARISEAAGSVGCFGSGRKEGLLLSEADEESKQIQFARRFAHRIVVSDVMSQHRWSDRKPSDLLFLSSQMITTESGRMTFADMKAMDEMETKKTDTKSRPGEHSSAEIDIKRSMSEIIGFNRFQPRSSSSRNNNTLLPVTKPGEPDEQKWFSIAGKTLQSLAGKGRGNGSGTDKVLH